MIFFQPTDAIQDTKIASTIDLWFLNFTLILKIPKLTVFNVFPQIGNCYFVCFMLRILQMILITVYFNSIHVDHSTMQPKSYTQTHTHSHTNIHSSTCVGQPICQRQWVVCEAQDKLEVVVLWNEGTVSTFRIHYQDVTFGSPQLMPNIN